jgi:predicted aspartyl protease
MILRSRATLARIATLLATGALLPLAGLRAAPPYPAATPAPAQPIDLTTRSANDSEPGAPEPLYAAPTRLDRIGRIVVPVMINGRGPFGFILDTGATHAAISARAAQLLGLELQPGSMLLNGVTGTEPVTTVEVARLEAGDLVLEHRPMPVLGHVMANADGILGVENLMDKRILVDFVHDRVVIARSRNESAPHGFILVPVRMRLGGLMAVDASIGRVTLKAVIDTGSEGTLGNEVLAGSLGLRPNPKRPPREVSGATSPVQEGHSFVIPRVTLGSAQIANIDVTFGDIYVFKLWQLDRQPAVVIGMDVLGKADTLIIDYRRKELQIRFPGSR